MPVVTSTGFPEAEQIALGKVLPGPWLPAINSVGIKVGYLVRQLADIYINHHAVHYWDTCAPQVILEEAGGEMTFFNGKALHYPLLEGANRHASPTLATNGARHRETLRFLRAIGAK
jgi:3'(2'), 5'-bisphosphate nucleotidase